VILILYSHLFALITPIYAYCRLNGNVFCQRVDLSGRKGRTWQMVSLCAEMHYRAKRAGNLEMANDKGLMGKRIKVNQSESR
jgi:hypothetical protein